MSVKNLIRLLPSFIVIIAFITLSYFLLATSEGLRATFILLEKIIPFNHNIILKNIQGRWLGPIYIGHLRYKTASLVLVADNLFIDWNPKALFNHKIDIHKFSFSNATVLVTPLTSKKSHASPSKPLYDLKNYLHNIIIRQVAFKQLTINYGGNFAYLQGSIEKNWDIVWQAQLKQPELFLIGLQGKGILNGKIKGTWLSPEFIVNWNQSRINIDKWLLEGSQAELHIFPDTQHHFLANFNAKQLTKDQVQINRVSIRLKGSLTPLFVQGNINQTRISYQKTNQQRLNFDISPLLFLAQTKQNGINASLETTKKIPFQGKISLLLPNYFAHHWPSVKQSVIINMDLALNDLKKLPSALSQFVKIEGNLKLHTQATGTFSSLQLSGLTMDLQKGNIRLMELGLTLPTTISARLNHSLIIWNGKINSGLGSLNLQGKTNFLTPNFSTEINAIGNHLQLIQTPLYKLTGSPNIQLKLSTQGLTIIGSVLIESGDFIFDNNEKSQIDLSSDVVFLNEKKKSLLNFPISWDLSLKIQGLVTTRYQALASQIEGNLRLIKTEKSLQLGIGQLNLVKGKYSYLGQVLKIGKGSSLLFTGGPLTNPKLNITAEREVVIFPQSTSTYGGIENTQSLKALPSQLGSADFISIPTQFSDGLRKAKIGIKATGSAQNPVIVLFSDPADAITSKTELLSYLLTGEPSSNLSGAGIQLLVGALSTMNHGNSGNTIDDTLNQLKKKIGLNNISVRSMPIMDPQTGVFLPNASVVLDKILTPKLSLSYSMGLLKPINIFQVNLSLANHLSLQSRNTNYSQGIDLIFKKEKE